MTATTHSEQSALAIPPASEVGALALITLSPEKYTAEVYQPFKDQLASAIDSVRGVDYDIKTTAGMAVAVKSRALFRDLRIAADKERKARKEPITKIGKLLESGFDQVEERATPLELLFDTDIKAEEDRKEVEKQAKIAAERARTDAIQARINAVRALPASVIGKTAVEISQMIYELASTISEDQAHAATFEEFAEQYKAVRLEVLESLAQAEKKQLGIEADARQAEVDRIAEIAQIEAERAILAKQRAEAERVAAENAAEAKRLADLAAVQAAEQARIQAQAEANLKAERDAQAEVLRIERQKAADAQAERDRIAAEAQAVANAELKAKQDALNADIAAHNARLAAAEKAERVAKATHDDAQRCQKMADQATADAHAPSPTLEELAEVIGDAEMSPTDAELCQEIREMCAEIFGMTHAETDARMASFVWVVA